MRIILITFHTRRGLKKHLQDCGHFDQHRVDASVHPVHRYTLLYTIRNDTGDGAHQRCAMYDLRGLVSAKLNNAN